MNHYVRSGSTSVSASLDTVGAACNSPTSASSDLIAPTSLLLISADPCTSSDVALSSDHSGESASLCRFPFIQMMIVNLISLYAAISLRISSSVSQPPKIKSKLYKRTHSPGTFIDQMSPDTKDLRRRVSHNEVERRRRDRINTWIAELHKLLPPNEQAKAQYQSKGMVLKRVCEYFQKS
ncbi:unnamed protein product [Protopolystoma xenopodis]|uniref:BHLH domain-containing protein n=1 Tax=Protopolystoma xenopodis TaxID=117903 RepID=A0A448WES0_9PLAT|nr:unnamed protein product [Protopolystoma xenopodis]